MHRCLAMWCGLNMAGKNLFQSFNERRSSDENRPTIRLWLTKVVDVVLKNKQNMK